MNKFFLLLVFLFQISIFGQKIGFVSEINPKLKHIHAEVGDKVGVEFTEVFSYSLNDFLKNMILKSKADVEQYNDFDFEIIRPSYQLQLMDKKKIEKLNDYCKQKGIEKLVIFFRNDIFIKTYSPYKNIERLKFDFGILSQVRKKNVLFFMNNSRMFVYDMKTQQGKLTNVIGKNNLQTTYDKFKSDNAVVDKHTKKLVNSEEIQTEFVKSYEAKILANFQYAISN